MADALSRKSLHVSQMMVHELDLVEQFRDLSIQVDMSSVTLRLALLEISCDLKDQIRHEQGLDKELQDRRVSIAFSLEDDGLIRFRQRICVPKGGNLKGQILEEAHKSKFSIHPGATKMYQDLKERFWWPGMKRDVA